VDGDVIVTREDLVFYAFGYVHPPNRAIAYLKYVPKALQRRFPLAFLETEWHLGEQTLVRPARLYSPENYRAILATLRQHFPEYVYDSASLGKPVVAIPRHAVKRRYQPRSTLQRLLDAPSLDPLPAQAVQLVRLLARSSGVPVAEFGVHGSIALGTYTHFSDIDLSVYGGTNFPRVRDAMPQLVEQQALRYLVEEDTDRLRRNKGTYQGRKFVVNAIRNPQEIRERYGQYEYRAVRQVDFTCRIADDAESHFKPAIYRIADYQPLGPDSALEEARRPTELAALISTYRGVARRGQRARGCGTLEEVWQRGTRRGTRVVVGSGTIGGREYLWPITS
jgi:predicted nucleotidyltransferase